MKTSIDLPDDLYRRVKAKSAMERRTVREVATALLANWVSDISAETSTVEPHGDAAWLYRWSDLGRRIAELELSGEGDGDATSLVGKLRADRR